MTSVLLLSGGLDSACLAVLAEPALAIFIDYGQRPAAGERRAARTIAYEFGIALTERTLDLTPFGDGLLATGAPSVLQVAPTPEWFPFRNQFLLTAAAAVATQVGAERVMLGLTAGDEDRHADGTRAFVEQASALLQLQEGNVQLSAPAHRLSSDQLLRESGLPERLWHHTFSCHVAPIACGQCPGCVKRGQVLTEGDC